MEYRMYVLRVFTRNWPEALAFYRDTMGWPLGFEDERLGWAQFELGGCCIGLERLAADDPEAEELVGRFVGCSIETDDIEQAYAELSARGVEFTSPPTPQDWGGVLAHFKDVDGNILTLLGSLSEQ
jgi:predicted enzyme related to lactoylglutathione lyase